MPNMKKTTIYEIVEDVCMLTHHLERHEQKIIDDEEDNRSLDDNVSLDTQEDIFLADLVAKDEVNVDTRLLAHNIWTL